MRLEQRRGDRRRHDIDRPMTRGECGEQRRGEDDIAQEGRLNDEGLRAQES